MRGPQHPVLQDLAIRFAGLALIALGALAIRILYRRVHMPPQHDATLAEFCLAAIGFMSASLGSGLTALGRHIHDRVPVSARWAVQPDAVLATRKPDAHRIAGQPAPAFPSGGRTQG